jgi:hypothetical protein
MVNIISSTLEYIFSCHPFIGNCQVSLTKIVQKKSIPNKKEEELGCTPAEKFIALSNYA